MYMWGVRKICFNSLLPYTYKNGQSSLKEKDLFLLPGEDEIVSDSLEDVQKQVEEDKKFWEKIDNKRKDVSSTC